MLGYTEGHPRQRSVYGIAREDEEFGLTEVRFKKIDIFQFPLSLFAKVSCNGEELSLMECKYKTVVKCARSEVAGVKCSQRGGFYKCMNITS